MTLRQELGVLSDEQIAHFDKLMIEHVKLDQYLTALGVLVEPQSDEESEENEQEEQDEDED